MTDKAITWYIAGLGSISSLCVATAFQSQISITPIVRQKNANQTREFIDLNKRSWLLPKGALLNEIQQISHLIVPLKSYDIVPFLKQVASKLTTNAQVILCHNGLGTIEPALDILPTDCNLYFCTTNNGVFKEENRAIYAGAGPSFWQLVRQGNSEILDNQAFAAIFPNATQSNELSLLLWQKLIVNCAINPLTAIHKVKNGELAEAKFQPIVEDIVKEAVLIANMQGIHISFADMLSKVQLVIKQTSANTSSMLQDVNSDKPTEIDYITGYLLNLADKTNSALPVNASLYKQVKTL
jgi:2-dehydropantoate 2-reductase